MLFLWSYVLVIHQLAVYILFPVKVTCHPQNGLSVQTFDDFQLPPENWQLLSTWKLTNRKPFFFQNFYLHNQTFFEAQKSGIYYLSMHLNIKAESYKEVSFLVKVSSQTDFINAKYTVTSHTKAVQLQDTILIDLDSVLSISLHASWRLKVTKASTLCLQHISSYEKSIGTIAQPRVDLKTYSSNDAYYLVNWKERFSTTNDFSTALGSYMPVIDGMYIIICKLIFINISNFVSVSIYKDTDEIYNTKKYYSTITRYDTLSFSYVKMMTRGSRMSVKLKTSSNRGYISRESTFSVLYFRKFESQLVNGTTYSFLWKERKAYKANEGEVRLSSWKHQNNSLYFNGGFYVKKRGYYMVIADIKYQYGEASLFHSDHTKFSTTLRIDNRLDVQLLDYVDERYPRAYGSRVLFLMQQDLLQIYLKSEVDLKVLENSSLLIYQIPFRVTTLFSLHTDLTKHVHFPLRTVANSQLTLKDISVDTFSIKYENEDGFFEIIETGVYYIVLTSSIERLTEMQSLEMSIIIEQTTKPISLLLSTCNALAYENCFIPLMIKLRKGEKISIIMNSTRINRVSFTDHSFLEIRLLKPLLGFSQSLPEFGIINKIKVTVPGVLQIRDNTSYKESVKIVDDKVILQETGVYIVTCNLIISAHERIEIVSFSIQILKNGRTLVENTKKIYRNQNKTNIPLISGQWLHKNDQLDIVLSHKSDKSLKWSVLKGSRISINLVSRNEQELLVVDHLPNTIFSSKIQNEIWRPTSLFPYKQSHTPESFLEYRYDIRAKRTFAAAVSVSIIAKAKSVGEISFIKASLSFSDAAWTHLSAADHNIRLNEVITLQMSGVVILHQDDMIKVSINISDSLKIQILPGTLLTLVVLADCDEKNMKHADFNSNIISVDNDFVEKEAVDINGVFAVSVERLNTTSKYLTRRSLEEIFNVSKEDKSIIEKRDRLPDDDINKVSNNTKTYSRTDLVICNNGVLLEINSINFIDKVTVIMYFSSGADLLSCVPPSKLFSVKTKILYLGDTSAKLSQFKVNVDGGLCNTSPVFDNISPWLQQDKYSIINEWFYKSLLYQFVLVNLNLFINQKGAGQGSVVLYINGRIEDGFYVNQIEIPSSNIHHYSALVKLYLKKNDVLQLAYLCRNTTGLLLMSSKVDVFEKEEILSGIDDAIPVFYQTPATKKIASTAYYVNYSCKVVNNENVTYYWNKIDLHNGHLYSNISQTKEHSVRSETEESGYYYCTVTYDNLQMESGTEILNITDDNECVLMHEVNNTIKKCHSDASCTNLIGLYECKCYHGFTGDGYLCEDINECAITNICGNFSTCINHHGGYNCMCDYGYHSIDEKDCEDIDECAEQEDKQICNSFNSTCKNLNGGYTCECDKGYHKFGEKCVDSNECECDPSVYPCHEHAVCLNTQGSFVCHCDNGWAGNGEYCQDINECTEDNFKCAPNATCENLSGTYRCKCNPGFKGDGKDKCEVLGCIPPPYCTGEYLVTWWRRTPYIKTDELLNESNQSDDPTGLFRDVLMQMIIDICSNCSEIKFSLPFNTSTGVESAALRNITDFACPLYGSKDQERFGNYPFIPIVESPGITFYVKVQNSKSDSSFESLAGSWPLLVATILLSLLSGVIMWFLDTAANPEEFPHSFLKGSLEGFWWAFITMTTVGYGDKAPRSLCARAFAIVWVLVGLVIISTFTATVTTVLTTTALSNEATLYATKIGALANSEEFQLGVQRNADVRAYGDISDILQALRSGEIEGILLDAYIAGEFQEVLQDYKLQNIFEHVFFYGVVLSRDAQGLEQHIRSYVEKEQGSILNTVSKVIKPLKEQKSSVTSSSSSTAVVNFESPLFWNMMVVGGISFSCLLFVGFLWDFLYWRQIKKIQWNIKDKCMLLNRKKNSSIKVRTVWNSAEFHRNAFQNETSEIKEQISQFAEEWVKRLTELESKHEMELNQTQEVFNKTKIETMPKLLSYKPYSNRFLSFGKHDELGEEV